MSLLGNIAAALSAGVGEGMVGAGKWGIEEEAQAKKEAADNARLQEQLKRDDARTQAYKDSDAARLKDNKADRAARAEEARLNRESNERIAAMQRRGAGGGGESSSLRELKFIDSQIADFDTTIKDLTTAYAAEMDPEKQKAIAGQIDAWRAKRQAFVTSDIVQQTIASNGKLGQLYGAALYGGASTNSPKTTPKNNIQPSPLQSPQRPVVKLSGGLLHKMSESGQPIGPNTTDQAPGSANTVQPGDIWGRVKSDVSWLGNKIGSVGDGMNEAYRRPLGN